MRDRGCASIEVGRGYSPYVRPMMIRECRTMKGYDKLYVLTSSMYILNRRNANGFFFDDWILSIGSQELNHPIRTGTGSRTF